jgi:GntP family gluconate:H+ symporter
VLLVILIAWVRLHPAVALCVAALSLGVVSGMPLERVPLSFTSGVGGLLGHIAIVLGLGAILGNLLARSGGATALGTTLVDGCGEKGLPWALMGLGILVGMPVFFEVGLVLMLPIVAAAARRSERPPILVGLPLMAGLSIAHGTLPPHPAAMLAATQYHADLGRTILWGLVVGLPAATVAGPVLGWFLTLRWRRRVAKEGIKAAEEGSVLFEASLEPVQDTADAKDAGPSEEAPEKLDSEGGGGFNPCIKPAKLPRALATEGCFPQISRDIPNPSAVSEVEIPEHERVPAPAGPVRAAAAILLPVALIFLGSWADTLAAPGGSANRVLHFAGSPDVALLIAVLAALITLGGHIQTGHHHGRELLRRLTSESFEPIASVLVILAAAGGLSGILRDSGAAQATVSMALGAHMPPLVLAWLLAAAVRISMGSATVATAVTAGVLAPMAGHLGVRPELLVLATGTGSIILSHVNDPGFWMIQSFFKLDLKETLATWTVLETVLSVAGLGMTLLLAAVLR